MEKSVYELVRDNADTMKSLASAGVAVEDYKHLQMYEDYRRLSAEGLKKTYIVFYLCDQYELSERSVWRIIRKFKAKRRIG